MKRYGREHMRYAFWAVFWERTASEKVDVCGACMDRIVASVGEVAR